MELTWLAQGQPTQPDADNFDYEHGLDCDNCGNISLAFLPASD